jgi:hypothetical protein
MRVSFIPRRQALNPTPITAPESDFVQIFAGIFSGSKQGDETVQK